MVKRVRSKHHSPDFNMRRQEVLFRLSQHFLDLSEPQEMMNAAVSAVAKELNVELCKVLLWKEEDQNFLLHAGVGWKPGLVGSVRVAGGKESQAGYTVMIRQPVVVEDFMKEKRFTAPALLREHGVVCGLSVPMISGDRVLGVMGAHSRRRRSFNSDDVSFLSLAAHDLALALQRAASEHHAQSYRAMVASGIEFQTFAQQYADTESFLRAVTEKIAHLLGVERCAIILHQPASGECHMQWPAYGTNDKALAQFQIPAHDARAVHAAWPANQPVLVFEDHQLGARLPTGMRMLADEKNIAVARLEVRGQFYGSLRVANKKGDRFTQEDVLLLGLLSQEIVPHLYLLHLEKNYREKIEKIATWSRQLFETLSTGDAEEVLQNGIEMLSDIIGARYGAVGLPDDSGALSRFFHTPIEGEMLNPPVGCGLLGLMLRENQVVRLDDLTQHPSFSGFPPGHPVMKTFLGVPIRVGERILGRVYLTEKKVGKFTEEDAHLAALFALNVGLFYEGAQMAQAIRESEERYRALFTGAVDGILVMDGQGRYVDANPAVCAMLGYTRDEILEKKIGDLSPAEKRELNKTMFQELTHNGKVEGAYALQRQDGQLISVEFTAAQAGPNLYLAILRDITQRLSLENQLRQSQKMEAVGQLAGGVAHDFNNLLTGIKGYIELALNSLAPEAPLYQGLREANHSVDLATALTRQLLTFSRRQIIAPRVLNLNDEIANFNKMLQRLIQEDIEIKTTAAPDLWNVNADPAQIEQVIMNLVVNARDAMPDGGLLHIETANVTLEANDLATPGFVEAGPVRPGRHVLLCISDTGSGMDRATLSHIFEPFFTTKETGKGTGLGLAVVYGIVKQHGGHLRIESAPGRGTTFKIYFPAVEARTAAPPREKSARLPQGTETILLVEDHEVVRKASARSLEHYGYTVLTAGNAEEAMQLFQAHRDEIALLVTDVVMPGMGGEALYKRLSAERPELKVLYVSGYTANMLPSHDAAEILRPFLNKPYTPQGLAQKVREVLEA